MFFSRSHAIFISFVCYVLLTSCGVIKPRFEDYEDDNATVPGNTTGPADASTECGAAALKLFTDNIQPTIAASCAIAGCHASGQGANKLPLSGSAVESNRTQFYTYSAGSTTKLTTYINSANHPGKNAAANLSSDSVAEWVTKENDCAQ